MVPGRCHNSFKSLDVVNHSLSEKNLKVWMKRQWMRLLAGIINYNIIVYFTGTIVIVISYIQIYFKYYTLEQLLNRAVPTLALKLANVTACTALIGYVS